VSGIIVDDAIIITENVQRHLESGKSRAQAALDGTVEVFGSVFSATLTTAAAFAPLLMLTGTVGQVMAIVPTVVIFSLAASLLEAFFILPGHLAHYASQGSKARENVATRWLKVIYRPVLHAITNKYGRYITAVGVVAIMVGVGALATTMRQTLQIDGNPYFVMVNIDLPPSVDAQQTRLALARVERLVHDEASDLVVWHYATTGRQRSPDSFPVVGQQYGQLKIGFHNRSDVFDRVPGFLDSLRQHLNDDPSVVDFSLQMLRGGPPSGRDIDVWVRSRDLEELDPFVDVLAAHLRQRPGVLDVRVSAGRGADAVKIDVDPEVARRYGLTEGDIAVAARASIAGLPSIEISDRERNTPVRVRWAGSTALGLDQVGDLPVVTSQFTMRLRDVASIHRVREPQRIDRVDRQRAVRISATVDPDVSTPEREQAAFDIVYADEKAHYPSVDIFVGGALADSQESFSQLPGAALVAGLLIFVVLAIQFRSYVQPLIILSAVPLGMAGVVLGLFSVGMDLSFIALIGAVGLIGIVVNDSLVLVDFINRARRDGMSARDAAIQGGLLRLRPILVTTVTTVGGLAPLGLGIMGREPLLAPMAASIGFGLAFATALTLIAIPVIYLIIDDLSSVFRWRGATAMAKE
ncbi:MAG: multidrug efflux pump subunit AcrB, partial [Kiritimatiellia bacterium]